MNYFSREELLNIGFLTLGQNILISKDARFYNPQNILLGNNIRIDDFCVLSAGKKIKIEDNVHLAVGCTLIGQGEIYLSSFSGLSARVAIYTSHDDYSGDSLTNPTIDNQYKNIVSGDVFIGRHVIVGYGSVILPKVVLEEGVAIGALSFVKNSCKSFGIYAGNPLKFIKQRSRNLLSLEKKFNLNLKRTDDSFNHCLENENQTMESNFT